MNRCRCFFLLFLLAFACSAMGQTDANFKDKPKPKKKEHARFSLVTYYFSEDYNFKHNIIADLDYSRSAGLARHMMVGFSFNIPIGHVFFLRPEAVFALNTDWEKAAEEQSVLNELTYGYRHREGVLMDVPFYFGAKWSPAKIFVARAYVGPAFHFGWLDGKFYYPFRDYSLTAGAGVDLLNFVTIDGGYRLGMDGISFSGMNQWFLKVGLLM